VAPVCHDTRSTPPTPPTLGGSCLAEPWTLLSPDGTCFAAFLARPAEPRGRGLGVGVGVGVVVLPDVRGLAPFYTQLAVRLAEQGNPTVALDWFGRSAGADIAARGEEFPQPEHLASLSRTGMQDDLVAAADLLRSPAGGACSTVAAVGFCMGGRAAFLAAAPRFGLAGVVGFYGAPGMIGPYGPGPTQEAAELAGPILAIFGSADEGIPPEEVTAFDHALTAAGVGHEVVVYPGAPHGFFDVTADEHATDCADAWSRVLRFLRQLSPAAGR
jgi:carboxymethylenebutenolidase